MIRTCAALIVLAGTAPLLAIDFDTEIVPVLTRSGCNAGACHGAAAGRGGLRLSLLGSDPALDFGSIVEEFEGRRVNLVRPLESLLLAKPSGRLDHEGGVPLHADEPGYERVRAWIADGARRSPSRRLTRFQTRPTRQVAGTIGEQVELRAEAEFDNAPSENVTRWTIFTSADPAAVEIDAAGNHATVHRRGQHVVIARFLDRVVPLTIVLPMNDIPLDLAGEPRSNTIDDLVLRQLDELHLCVSPSASDSAYVRRVTLDLTGRLPEPGAVAEFVADPSADKRTRLVERLLASDACVDFWTFRFALLLRIRPLPNEREASDSYYTWLRHQIRDSVPFDRVAQELLTATGDSHLVGAANFARMVPDARGQAEHIGQLFLGVRLQCANCHNHPLDRWTQDDYHGLAAIFARLDRGRVVAETARGAVTNLRTGAPAVPRIPGTRYLDGSTRERGAFADWLVEAENPYFARALVNRLWRAMFGRGLVDPTDDLRDTNPATHPELLDQLARDFIEHGDDLRHTLRRIALSETYRRDVASTPGNEHDDRYYSHALRRPLDPEVLADAIAQVTDVYDSYGEYPAGTRAVNLVDPLTPAPSLDILGRCSRATACEGEADRGGLPARLHQINGPLLNRKIVAPDGRLRRLFVSGASNGEIVAEFYARAVGRLPSEAERGFWDLQLGHSTGDDRLALLEDFAWSLLTCSEFATNH